jgi:DNA-binding PadR family transcriptional regulator
MSTETGGAEDDLPRLHELAKRIQPATADVLGAAATLDGEADAPGPTATEMQRAAGVPRGSTHHHVTTLRDDWRLIAEVGEVESAGAGIPAKCYALTERGERFVERGDADVSEPLSPAEQQRLLARVEELEERADRTDGLAERVDELEGFREWALDKFDAVFEAVNPLLRRVDALEASEGDADENETQQ